MKMIKRLLFAFLLCLLIPSMALAVGTVTVTKKDMSIGNTGAGLTKIIITWVADASAATVPDTDFILCGVLRRIVTDPGATAPSANYDITLIDESGLDLFTTGGANRSATLSQGFIPMMDGVTTGAFFILYCGNATFNLDNNAVNSATGTVTLFITDF